MKKLVRIVLGIIVLIVAIAACGLGYLYASYPKVPPAGEVRIVATPEALARGEYLTHHVSICLDCHSERDWDKFAGPLKPGTWGKGGEAFDKTVDPTFPGAVYAKNITPAGIGSWTDGEVLAFRDCWCLTRRHAALSLDAVSPFWTDVRRRRARDHCLHTDIEADPERQHSRAVAGFPAQPHCPNHPRTADLQAAPGSNRQGRLRRIYGQRGTLQRMPHADRQSGPADPRQGVRRRQYVQASHAAVSAS